MSRPTADHRSRLAARLGRHVQGDVRFDATTRGLYATDASIYQIKPLGVVLPRSLDDVEAVMGVAREEGAPVLPRGAGTSQCGQTVGRAVVVDTSRHLNRLLEVDREARTAWVEPGLVLDELNRRLAPSGLCFPVDVATASRATLGGMAGNNSGGARSIRYGIMADNVLAVEAVLPDGRVAVFGPEPENAARQPEGAARTSAAGADVADVVQVVRQIAAREADKLDRRVPKVLRHVAGYNLHRLLRPGASMAELLVGSEGTLAFFRRIQLRLWPVPSRRVLGVCGFPSLADALGAVPQLATLEPHAVELLDDAPLQLARENPSFRATVEAVVDPAARSVLLVEFADGGADAMPRDPDALSTGPGARSRRLAELDDLVRGLGPGWSVAAVEDPVQQAAVWSVRRAALNIVMSRKGARKPVSVVEDCAVPLDRLAEYAAAVEAVFARHGTSGTWYAHASVGCLHVRPSLDMKDPADVATFRAVAEEVHDVVAGLGGSHSGEHGDGILRSEFIEPVLGARLAQAFREVKRAFDPDGMMNPGKIVDPPRMDDRRLFRYAPDYGPSGRLPTVPPRFVETVESCNNNGACRKLEPGVMCPSYRATREEVDTTRGRANVLRLAMTGQLGADGLFGEAVAQALDLCVGCKACKRECPAGVDMARLKAGVLHLRHQRQRPGRRTRLFAGLPRLAPVASKAAWALNARNQSRVLAWAGERLLGVSATRALPEWSRQPFRDAELSPPSCLTDSLTNSGYNLSNGTDEAPGRPVVLFADTFNRYFEPHVLRAAAAVLRALGIKPTVPATASPDGEAPRSPLRPLCCGRTYISAGMLDHARTELRRTVGRLAPLVAAGMPVVGVEPSCLLTLRDEALDLVPGDDARRVAARSFLLDEYLAARPKLLAEADTTKSASRDRTAVVHGHCHQKADGDDGATETVLSTLAGMKTVSVPSSCCGMAGSFGYEAEHAEVSRTMGELALLPAVRAAPAGAVVVANGFSCRAQILDGTGRTARHVAEVLVGL